MYIHTFHLERLCIEDCGILAWDSCIGYIWQLYDCDGVPSFLQARRLNYWHVTRLGSGLYWIGSLHWSARSSSISGLAVQHSQPAQTPTSLPRVSHFGHLLTSTSPLQTLVSRGCTYRCTPVGQYWGIGCSPPLRLGHSALCSRSTPVISSHWYTGTLFIFTSDS